jgi:hypothetical protein
MRFFANCSKKSASGQFKVALAGRRGNQSLKEHSSMIVVQFSCWKEEAERREKAPFNSSSVRNPCDNIADDRSGL